MQGCAQRTVSQGGWVQEAESKQEAQLVEAEARQWCLEIDQPAIDVCH